MTGRAQSRRLWVIGGAVAAVVIVLVGWLAFISPKLSSTATIRDDTASAEIQNTVLQAKNAKLKRDNDQAATLRAELAAALAQLPSDGGLPAFTRQLSAQATAHSVTLSSVIVAAVTPLAAGAGGAAAPAGVVTPAGAAAGAVATTAAAVPVGASGAAPDSAGALVQIPITITATGLGRDDIAFLKAIQVTGPRRALVTSSQLSPVGGGAAGGSSAGGSSAGIDGPCSLSLSLTIFSAPLPPTAQAALEKLLSGK